MIISRGRRYIFIHIPKTGGTSMALALEGRAMADDILLGDTPKAQRRRHRVKNAKTRGRLWKHAALADLEGLVSREEMRDFFVFTLVRNPWDRVLSYYHWLRRQSFAHPAVWRAKTTDFSEFLAAPEIGAALRQNGYPAYVTGPDGTEHCDAFVRLEALQEDLAPVEAHLGFALELPRANVSDRAADYRAYYSDEAAGLVAKICAEDIARFGYRF